MQGIRLAQQAWKEDPTLSPAALAYAEAGARRDGRAGRWPRSRHGWSRAASRHRGKRHGDAAGRSGADDAAQRLTKGNPDTCGKPHAPRAHGAGSWTIRRCPPPCRSRSRRWAESASAMGAARRNRGSRGRRYRGRSHRPARRAASCDDCRSRSPVALHRLRHGECRVAAGCPDCFKVGTLRWNTGPVATPIVQAMSTEMLLP